VSIDQRFERVQRGLEDVIEAEVKGIVEQREDFRARLSRVRAAAESDADLEKLDALRSFLLTETDLGPSDLIGEEPS
jgi:hypothetical protein